MKQFTRNTIKTLCLGIILGASIIRGTNDRERK